MSLTVILASASPRRKHILSLMREDFEIIVPDVDETVLPNETPEFYAMRVATAKCEAISTRLSEGNFMIITADTTVACEGRILGKPTSRIDAQETLSFLSGKKHQVISSLCVHLILNGKAVRECRIGVTGVTFKDLSPAIIDEYLEKTHYTDKAGSYAIQENGEMIVANTDGSHSAIVGFPVGVFLDVLADLSISEVFFDLKKY